MIQHNQRLDHGEHLTEDQLIQHYFAEGESLSAAERHLSECQACRTEFESIKATMNVLDAMEVPRRGEDYGAAVWTSVQHSLNLRPRPRWSMWFSWQRLAAIGATASLIVFAFVAGRQYPDSRPGSPSVATVAESGESARNRLLLVTLNDHLEQSQRMLTEMSNSDSDELPVERESAQDLLAANRLYRQTAKQAGDRSAVAVLEDLERYLIEAAHASPGQLKDLQRRMQEEDILFQLRVMNSQLRQRQTMTLPVQSH